MSSDGKTLFGRKYSCVVGPVGGTGVLGAIEKTLGIDVSDLRITFKVKKNLKREPNTATVVIYNLSRESRQLLESASKLVLRLEAGYEETGVSQLFLGEVRNAWSTKDTDGVSWMTTITTGDSEKEIQEARIHMSIGPKVPPDVALTAIARALKVGEGNVAQAVALLSSKGVASMFSAGTSISGNAARELTDICRSSGLEWSIQDGKLQFLDKDKALNGKAVLLAADTGLEGSPAIDFSEKGGVYVKAKARLIPELNPGAKVVFQSSAVNGGYRIEEVEYSGDTHGEDWTASLVCRSY